MNQATVTLNLDDFDLLREKVNELEEEKAEFCGALKRVFGIELSELFDRNDKVLIKMAGAQNSTYRPFGI